MDTTFRRTWDNAISLDGEGNQVLDNLSNGTYTIVGLGTNYVNIQMDYDHTTGTADYYVNGELAITNSASTYESYAPIVFFGGVDGNFNLVSLVSAHLRSK
jgi:hypothetical protein